MFVIRFRELCQVEVENKFLFLITGRSSREHVDQMRVFFKDLIKFPFGRGIRAKVKGSCRCDADQIGT